MALKRKADDDDDAQETQDQPRKLRAFGGGASRPGMDGPLRPSRTATNLPHARVASGSSAMPPLSKANRPIIQPRSRATSAPPKAQAPPPRPLASTSTAATRGRGFGARGARGGRGGRGGSSTGPQRPGPVTRSTVNNQEFLALQSQVTSIESARAADVARVASEMEAERTKVSELQANHQSLSKELVEARTMGNTHRRELANASEMIEELKRKHVREVDDLEENARKKERELRETKDELRYAQEDLQREREAVTSLKATVAHQSTAHIALNAQNSSLEAQLSALTSTLDCRTQDATQLRLDLEKARTQIKELEEEVQEAEMTRRRLHNTIQELKGNIRVYCRVRPVLQSEYPKDLSDDLDYDEREKLRNACMARIEFPDKKDHKDIVLSSTSESATGQERKETWNFSFDRVSPDKSFIVTRLTRS
jgi:kinesin family member C1